MNPTALPLTKSEWNQWRPQHPKGEYRDSIVFGDAIHAVFADRIEATIEHGWAKEPPTPAELDAWAARKIMGWISFASDFDGTPYWMADGRPNPPKSEWRPSTNLGQALEVVAKTPYRASIDIDAEDHASVRVDPHDAHLATTLYDGAYDEARVAEVILRHLHAELAS